MISVKAEMSLIGEHDIFVEVRGVASGCLLSSRRFGEGDNIRDVREWVRAVASQGVNA